MVSRNTKQKIADCLFWAYDEPICVSEPAKLKKLLGKVEYQNMEIANDASKREKSDH